MAAEEHPPVPVEPIENAKVIVNPEAGGGRGARLWPALRRELEQVCGLLSVAWTTAPAGAEELTRQALRHGFRHVIAVGGDGTVSEVANGFFEDGRLVAQEAALSVLTCGTGGDYRRTLGFPADAREAARRLSLGRTRTVDVGRLTFTDHGGREVARHFVNIASFGMGGAVDEAVRAMPYKEVVGGTAAFFYAIMNTMATYKNQPVDLTVDGVLKGRYVVRAVAVANGRFFGGGLEVAPRAAPDDGYLDVVVLGDFSRAAFVRHIGKLYAGTHLGLDDVHVFRGRTVTATTPALDPVLLDIDGEPLGRLPATFEILPRALRLRF